MDGNGANPGNRMLERIVAILDVVEVQASSASEIAERTELSVSTAHRLALAMVEHDFLRRQASGRFYLGPRFARSALEHSALPELTKLRDKTGETTQLWVRRGDDRVCLVTVDSQHELRATLPVGSRLLLPAGSSGRLLAQADGVDQELASNGWVESVSQRTPGLGSVSAPIYIKEQMIAAVCLAVPLSRVNVSPGADFGVAVAETARSIADTAGKVLN